MYRFNKNTNLYRKNIISFLDINDYNNFMRFHEQKILHTWYGCSIQKIEKEILIDNNSLQNFKDVINLFLTSDGGKNGKWLIQPFNGKKTYSWFTSRLRFPSNKLKIIKNIFNNNKISYLFKGAIETNNEGLSNIFCNLLQYPFLLKGSDIEIFNMETPTVIILNRHFTIDIITLNENLIKDFVSLIDKDKFLIKRYK